MKGLQKLQEEMQKQGEMISISLTCPVNNWIILRSLRLLVWGILGLISFPRLQDLRSGK